jgi:hypothetical protein
MLKTAGTHADEIKQGIPRPKWRNEGNRERNLKTRPDHLETPHGELIPQKGPELELYSVKRKPKQGDRETLETDQDSEWEEGAGEGGDEEGNEWRVWGHSGF